MHFCKLYVDMHINLSQIKEIIKNVSVFKTMKPISNHTLRSTRVVCEKEPEFDNATKVAMLVFDFWTP